MRQASVLGLDEPRWIPIPDDAEGMEVQIVPSAGAETSAILFNPTNKQAIRRVCTKLFRDFKGYLNGDGEPVQNSLAVREEIYSRMEVVRETIATEVQRLQAEAARGEG